MLRFSRNAFYATRLLFMQARVFLMRILYYCLEGLGKGNLYLPDLLFWVHCIDLRLWIPFWEQVFPSPPMRVVVGEVEVTLGFRV